MGRKRDLAMSVLRQAVLQRIPLGRDNAVPALKILKEFQCKDRDASRPKLTISENTFYAMVGAWIKKGLVEAEGQRRSRRIWREQEIEPVHHIRPIELPAAKWRSLLPKMSQLDPYWVGYPLDVENRKFGHYEEYLILANIPLAKLGESFQEAWIEREGDLSIFVSLLEEAWREYVKRNFVSTLSDEDREEHGRPWPEDGPTARQEKLYRRWLKFSDAYPEPQIVTVEFNKSFMTKLQPKVPFEQHLEEERLSLRLALPEEDLQDLYKFQGTLTKAIRVRSKKNWGPWVEGSVAQFPLFLSPYWTRKQTVRFLQMQLEEVEKAIKARGG